MVNTDNVVDAARAAHLTDTIGAHDTGVASELQDTARELEERQVLLRAQREDLASTIASLGAAPGAAAEAARHGQRRVRAGEGRGRATPRGDQADVSTGARVCPVHGPVVFTDDFHEPRRPVRVHEGIDMPALEGTPVVAVVDGVDADESANGGNGAWLYGADDVGYYHAHFIRHEGPTRLVTAGDVIGYVGSTGRSTGPHLHFEVHRRPAAPRVNPYALLLGLCAEEMTPPRG